MNWLENNPKKFVALALIPIALFIVYFIYVTKTPIGLVRTKTPFYPLEQSTSTITSQKPRDKIVNYTVKQEDSLDIIAKNFDVSTDTIRWANNLQSDQLHFGQVLKIPPITGIVHTVQQGETIETIAAEYHTTSQKIKDFPFNDFQDFQTFSVKPGQTLYIPDGTK